jgi:ubiquinone/menaquinone biosynthesis C-methylase UbiE
MGSAQSTAAVRRRYGWVASIYDWANLERVLYADARVRAIELLDLRPGARVLDLACGTGANFALIEQRIGHTGELVGVDVAPQMLDKARARAARGDWSNVRLREGDVCQLAAECLGGPFDAAVCTLGLSVTPQCSEPGRGCCPASARAGAWRSWTRATPNPDCEVTR